MTFVWQIREKNTGLWIRDSSQGWYSLTTQDGAYMWSRQDLAEKALKKVLKNKRDAEDPTSHRHTWFKGFEHYSGDGNKYKVKKYKNVEFEIVCSKLVYAETVEL